MQLSTDCSFPRQADGTRWSGAWSCLFIVIYAHTDLMLVGTLLTLFNLEKLNLCYVMLFYVMQISCRKIALCGNVIC